MRDERTAALAALFRRTSQAHHTAFSATDGADPDWPIWYADALVEPLSRELSSDFTRSQLVKLLIEADQECSDRAPDAEWTSFYAAFMLERFGAQDQEMLALYHYDACPFCRHVRGTVERLGIDIELRDIRRDRAHWEALVAARGRATVPVLRCTSADSDRWMPESRDIIRYLEHRFG